MVCFSHSLVLPPSLTSLSLSLSLSPLVQILFLLLSLLLFPNCPSFHPILTPSFSPFPSPSLSTLHPSLPPNPLTFSHPNKLLPHAERSPSRAKNLRSGNTQVAPLTDPYRKRRAVVRSASVIFESHEFCLKKKCMSCSQKSILSSQKRI